MNIQRVLKKYHDIETDLLLSYVLGKPKEFLYLNPTTRLNTAQQKKLLALIKRRQAGEPIAYILGYKYFYGLKFKVNRQVLIPRPETEWLVDRAVHLFPFVTAVTKGNKPFRILDLGTGSGCIAISIAKELQRVDYGRQIVGSDISTSALRVAKANAQTHGVNVTFVQSDLFKDVPGKFDIITANLPYVPQGMYELLYNNLKYEPKVAITDGGEVWEMYYRFFAQLPKYLKPSGLGLLEIDDGSKPDLQKMLKKLLPEWKTTFTKDLGGLWRYLEIKSPFR